MASIQNFCSLLLKVTFIIHSLKQVRSIKYTFSTEDYTDAEFLQNNAVCMYSFTALFISDDYTEMVQEGKITYMKRV